MKGSLATDRALAAAPGERPAASDQAPSAAARSLLDEPADSAADDRDQLREWSEALEEDLAAALEESRRHRVRIEKLTAVNNRLLAERVERTTQMAQLTAERQRLEREAKEAVDRLAKVERELSRTEQELAARQAANVRMVAEMGTLQSTVQELDAIRRELAERLETTTRGAKQRRSDAAALEEHIACLEGELRAERKAREAAMAEAADLRRQGEIAAARLEAALRVADTAWAAPAPPEVAASAAVTVEVPRAADNAGPVSLAPPPAHEPPVPRPTTTIVRVSRPVVPRPAAAKPAAPAPAAGQNRFLVVDSTPFGAEAAEQLSVRGYAASVVRSDAPVAGQVGGESAWAALLNLASSAGWMLATDLRRLAVRPLLACAVGPGDPNAIWFGSVDFAESPADDLRVADILKEMVPQVKRVLVLGDLADGLAPVADACKGAKLQVAVTLGDQETLKAVGTLRPEVIVVHVGPTCTSALRALLAVRTVEVTRHAPTLFLLATPSLRPDPVTLASELLALAPNGTMPRQELPGAFATALEIHRLKALTALKGR